MACRGAWRPVLEFLAAAIRRQTGIRDYIAGEKVIQGFLAAYLGATDHFVFHTERELEGTTGRRRSGNLPQGYADICLEPFLVRFADMRHGYVIELKYLKRSASATEERVAVATLPGRRTLGAAVPIGALHRPGARIPRLGTGAQRRDSPPADLKIARCAHPRRFLTARSIRARGQRPRRSTRRPSAAATANYGSPQGVARWGTCIAGGRVVEGSECRGRWREGAPAAAAAAKSTGGPVAGRGSRLGTATQRPLAGTLDCSRGGRRFGGPEGAALRNGADGHLF